MAILERVMQLKQSGMNDGQIIQTLQEEGITPREINDVLSQSKIKYEIYGQDQNNEEYSDYPSNIQPSMSQSIMYSDGNQSQQSFQQSLNPTQVPRQSSFSNQNMSPELENIPPPNEQFTPEQGSYDNEEAFQEYYPEYQPEYQEYQPSAAIDIETINEVAEQIIEEKQDKIKKEMSTFTKFKEEIAFEVQRMSSRLEKIEKTIDELQIAILRRIGDYGRDIQNISKEMRATQDSFSKILDPLTDNIRELKRITEDVSEKNPKKSKDFSEKQEESDESNEQSSKNRLKKAKDDFENYLR